MSDYAFTGKKGTGKSKLAVQIMQQALHDGRRVATNLNLSLEHLMPPTSRATATRIPDKPTAFDLFALGNAYEGDYDESKSGVLVLDELGTWLNSRSFQDKERMPVLDWLIHARKYGWDVYYLMQNIGQVDKQLRESLLEYVGRCVRFDKVPIPLLGFALNVITFGLLDLRLPRFHLCTIRMGIDPTGITVDRILFKRDDLNAAYDTRQVFSPLYDKGPYSMLSAWHLKGRYQPQPKPSFFQSVREWFRPRPQRQRPQGVHPRCKPLLTLPPDRRWSVARSLVLEGAL